MSSSPTPRRGEEAHTEACARLDEALERQRDLLDRTEAGTAGDEADEALDTVRHEIAARDAWVVWTERGMGELGG